MRTDSYECRWRVASGTKDKMLLSASLKVNSLSISVDQKEYSLWKFQGSEMIDHCARLCPDSTIGSFSLICYLYLFLATILSEKQFFL